jgi:hypothetical protein
MRPYERGLDLLGVPEVYVEVAPVAHVEDADEVSGRSGWPRRSSASASPCHRSVPVRGRTGPDATEKICREELLRQVSAGDSMCGARGVDRRDPTRPVPQEAAHGSSGIDVRPDPSGRRR